MSSFIYRRKTQFYETDAMGIVHHSRYLLFFEEARLQFLALAVGGKRGQDFLKKINYPLIHCEVNYRESLGFNEEVIIEYNVKVQKARLIFDYNLFSTPLKFQGPEKQKNQEKKKEKTLVTFGKTIHVAFDMKKRKITRLPNRILELLNPLES